MPPETVLLSRRRGARRTLVLQDRRASSAASTTPTQGTATGMDADGAQSNSLPGILLARVALAVSAPLMVLTISISKGPGTQPEQPGGGVSAISQLPLASWPPAAAPAMAGPEFVEPYPDGSGLAEDRSNLYSPEEGQSTQPSALRSESRGDENSVALRLPEPEIPPYLTAPQAETHSAPKIDRADAPRIVPRHIVESAQPERRSALGEPRYPATKPRAPNRAVAPNNRPTSRGRMETASAPPAAIDPRLDGEEASRALDMTQNEASAYAPTRSRISETVTPRVREAFQLGKSGALHAARTSFIEVLREIARAKDANQQTTRHGVALAEGLLALEEAEAFLEPQTEGGVPLDMQSLAASHHTPLLHAGGAGRWTLPHEARAMYHRYAEQQLGVAVGDEPAGSMCLYGLGKTYSGMAEREGAHGAREKSLSCHRAAVLAHAGNTLAANEVGVHLARAGLYDQAHAALTGALPHRPNSTLFRNLAVVERALGRPELAAAAEGHAQLLAAYEKNSSMVSRDHGVQWMNPGDFAAVPVDSRPNQPTAPATPSPAVAPMVATRTTAQAATSPAGPVRNFMGFGASATATAPPAVSQTTIR